MFVLVVALIIAAIVFRTPLLGLLFLAWPWLWKYLAVGLVLGYFGTVIHKRKVATREREIEPHQLFFMFLLAWPFTIFGYILIWFAHAHDKMSEIKEPEKIEVFQEPDDKLDKLNRLLYRVENTDLDKLARKIIKTYHNTQYSSKELTGDQLLHGIILKNLKELTDV